MECASAVRIQEEIVEPRGGLPTTDEATWVRYQGRSPIGL
jgi:hypothetical protein